MKPQNSHPKLAGARSKRCETRVSLELALLSFLVIWSPRLDCAASDLSVEILPQFNGAGLVFDTVTNRTTAGQVISVTRLDFLLSNFAVKRRDGSWLVLTNSPAYVSAREGRTSFSLPKIAADSYTAIRFLVGLTPGVNTSDPALYPERHPLNPNVNGLHWGWQGGYVFMALEGAWRQGQLGGGYSFHIANNPHLMTVEVPVALDPNTSQLLRLALDVGKIFSASQRIALTKDSSTTHSRPDDALATQLHKNIERAFIADTVTPVDGVALPPAASQIMVASNATPYRLTISSFFPRPALPLDNPLTEEGVKLGDVLFHDKRLSINNSQSCASCHDLSAAGGDTQRAFSVGAEGQAGTRNAMPLFNLAWKSSFFWDGRSATLREQVLQPIQNPIEMHETLTNVVAKLLAPPGQKGSSPQDYPALFARAFGSSEITADRIARALEQFLLTQVSHGSKFDRVLNGEAKFTEQEQRGFELFHTEYDPRREQFGADCFHCHGGPLFQSQTFANNGLDTEFKDLGRFLVTGRAGDKGKFAVPSLRNVELTAPYMHDGRFQTLEQVIEHYAKGIKRSDTLDPNLAKHPDGGVPLSLQDQESLVAFLKTLTDAKFQRSDEGIIARAQ